MRVRAVVVGLVAAAVAASVASATPPPSKGKPAASGAGCRPQVTVVLKGLLASAPAGNPVMLSLSVTGSNRHGQAFVKAAQPVSVATDASTVVRRRGAKTLSSLQPGDRVLVQARVCKADLAAGATPALSAARVIAQPVTKLGSDVADGSKTGQQQGKPSGNPGKGHGGGGAPNTIALIAPWGSSAYDGSTVTVTYAISAASSVPASAVAAVQAAIDHWNNCVNTGSNAFSETLAGTTFASSDSNCSAHNWRFAAAGAGASPLVTISVKKGGGMIAGSTKLSFDSAGFLAGARVQISGSSFGSQNDTQTVLDIAEHELGHVVGLGHSTVTTDLMYPILNGTTSFGSCEANGFSALYPWLGSTPTLPTQTSVSC